MAVPLVRVVALIAGWVGLRVRMVGVVWRLRRVIVRVLAVVGFLLRVLERGVRVLRLWREGTWLVSNTWYPRPRDWLRHSYLIGRELCLSFVD